MSMSKGVIDVHAHIVFEELLGKAGKYGPRRVYDSVQGITKVELGEYFLPKPDDRPIGVDPAARIEALDSWGIETQVACPSPLFYFNFAEAKLGNDFCRQYNDLLANWASHSERLKFFATVPTQDIDLACAEAQRAVNDLGALAIYFNTDLQVPLDHPSLDPLYAVISDLDVPLFLHPGVRGVDAPVRDDRLIRRSGHVVLGYPGEESLAVSTLIFGEVLRRHPKLDICLSHGGGASAFLYGRLRQFCTTSGARDGVRPISPEQFDEDYRRLWFDTHVSSAESFDLLIKVANPDRLVLGTNMGGWDFDRPEDFLTDTRMDLGQNARTLLRLP